MASTLAVMVKSFMACMDLVVCWYSSLLRNLDD